MVTLPQQIQDKSINVETIWFSLEYFMIHQIRVPLALITCGVETTHSNFLLRVETPCNEKKYGIASCEYWIMVGCKGEPMQLHVQH